jgi:urease accessory protein
MGCGNCCRYDPDMLLTEPVSIPSNLSTASAWQARLDLRFTRRLQATLLSRREHLGPLRVQKALYPEGEAVCHVLVLHPPSGIAGGDRLTIAAQVQPGAHALLTNPGAGKWYRSAGARAIQCLQFKVESGATLEWLPQENIVFNGAKPEMSSDIELAADAHYLGWEILCLGRRASGETFAHGALRLHTRLRRDGRPLWLERGQLDGGSELLQSPAGLAGFSVSATLLATTQENAPELLATCRSVTTPESGARHAITQLPGLLVARYLGHSSEAARHWLAGLWQVLRPALIGRPAQTPRIWNT